MDAVHPQEVPLSFILRHMVAAPRGLTFGREEVNINIYGAE